MSIPGLDEALARRKGRKSAFAKVCATSTSRGDIVSVETVTFDKRYVMAFNDYYLNPVTLVSTRTLDALFNGAVDGRVK